MDLAKTLIRSVVRAFYETRHALVIDALMVHSALPNEDLALLLGMQQKDLRKLCGRLREDRLLAVHSRQETREGMQRPIHRDYYYVDFHATIDSIKYRISHLERRVKDLYKPSEEKKDYYCPRCKSQWTQMEVLDSINPMTGEFSCHKCNGTLERHETTAVDRAGHERQSKLMSQIDPLLKLLRQIDQVDIPQNDFQTALSLQVPIQRDETINPSRRLEPVKPEAAVTVKGIKTEAAAPIEVSLVDASASAAEKAEALHKQELQNQLPEWHTKSTVTGERTALGNKEAARLATTSSSTSLVKPEDEEKKGSDTVDAQVEEYLQKMREEQAREALQQESEDEEDDDDFEDVGIGGSGVHTPNSEMSGAVNGNAPGSSLKVESESGSSLPGTSAVATPVPREDDGGSSPSKRVKLDSGAEKEAEKEEDSDEDEEFEDAL
ncbi:MAG: hypothetical protein MMC23_008778 [Stictis urceolatum]|nr:hypothetical protein [Stictis urceolata]